MFAANSAAGIPFPDTSATANNVRFPGKIDHVEVIAAHLPEGL